MIPYRVSSTVIGLVLCLIIFRLVRRGALQEKYSVVWFAVGILIVVLGAFPRIIDWLAGVMGVAYAPTLLFVLAIGVLLVQNIYLTIRISQDEARINKLAQEFAVQAKILDESVGRPRAAGEESESTAS